MICGCYRTTINVYKFGSNIVPSTLISSWVLTPTPAESLFCFRELETIREEVGYSHEIPFEIEKIKLEDLELKNLVGKVDIGRTPQGLVVQGQFEADTQLECVRCLRDFAYPLTWEFTELYAFNRKSVSESGLLLPEDAHIDMAPLIREYALLEIPISPLHDPDCKGLCPVCGQDLNVRDCGHRPDQDDSPFAKIRDLLDE